jgi:hypothetical protein
MIVPTALLTQDSYKALRKMVLAGYQIENIVRLPNESFSSAAGEVKVDTVILVVRERGTEPGSVNITAYSGYERILRIEESTSPVHGTIAQETWAQTEDYVWSFNTAGTDQSILQKCIRDSVSLEECAQFSLGLTPYDKYKGHTPSQIADKVFHASCKKDKTFKKLLAGNDVMRYLVHWNGEQWISYGPWLGAPREQRFFTEKRILVKQIIDWTTRRIWATIADEELYNTQNAFNLLPKEDWKLEYLVGIINSRLMTFYHRKRFLDEFKMRFQKILIKDCRRFPIHVPRSNDRIDIERHDLVVKLVEHMLALHKLLASVKTPHEKTELQNQIDATDRQIDRVVYELYGLTEQEIRIVEGPNQ